MRARRSTGTRVGSLLAGAATAAALTLVPLTLSAPAQAAVGAGHGDSGAAVTHDTSAPLSSYAGAAPTAASGNGKKSHFDKRDAGLPQSSVAGGPDAAVQGSAGTSAATPATGFEGIGVGDGFKVNSAPPDTDAAVGLTQIVEVVNTGFAVFDKTGGLKYGPVLTNTLFSGFGGACQTTNDGDGVVRYDRLADRWVIAQFANAGSTSGPYYECLAVSTSGDALGSYYRYSFQYAYFPDYPKLGVWPDAYYVTYNLFSGNTFKGAESCALDRAKMMAGAPATQQCFTTSTAYGGLLPVDNVGGTAPPAGEAALQVALGATSSSLATWQFHVDWGNPANSRFSGPTALGVASFSEACGGGTCIPQSGTNNQLDSLADRLMYHLSYRNLGDHESVVVTHSVTAGSATGVRWYELRNPAAPTLYQQGTYAPADGLYRWMGSAQMDKAGGIALGYSRSGSSAFPSVRYTGRVASDPLGTMTAAEGTIVAGTGSQTGTLHRWGDYSSMSIDPVDDCTFWYANEYIASSGSFNWSTRIGSFTLPGCSSPPPPPGDFTLNAQPNAGNVAQGGSTTTSIVTTAVPATSTGTIALTGSAPSSSGLTVSFSPTSVTAGGTSTMTVAAAAGASLTSPVITVTGTEGSYVHSDTFTATVTPMVNDFSISDSPGAASANQGGSVASTISTAVTSGSPQAVTFSASGVPAGVTAIFSPTSVTGNASSTLTLAVGSSAAPGDYPITVTGSATSGNHPTLFTLTVVANDFGVSLSPTAGSAPQGTSITTTVKAAVTSGSPQSVALAVSGLPSGVSASFNPTSVTGAGSSTLTLTLAPKAQTGLASVTVTGTGSYGPVHTAAYSLTVTTPSTSAVVNGGFETGTLSGWTTAGTVSASAVNAHSGSWDALLGASSPTNGVSSVAQTFKAQAGATKLSFWWTSTCPDTVRYDWATATLKDNTTGVTSTVLAKTCTNNGWTLTSAAVTAGHSYTLTLINRDDNYPGDPTSTRYDDVTVN